MTEIFFLQNPKFPTEKFLIEMQQFGFILNNQNRMFPGWIHVSVLFGIGHFEFSLRFHRKEFVFPDVDFIDPFPRELILRKERFVDPQR